MSAVIAITEHVVPGKRLGRHIEHDPESKFHKAPRHLAPLKTKHWKRHCPAYDQGDLGACTGNALAGALMTDGLYRQGFNFTEAEAVEFYKLATKIDDIPGSYPPDDTGSSGLAVAKIAKAAGYIKGYKHAFSVYHTLECLQSGPVIIGTNWYSSFDDTIGTKAEIVISPDAEVRGGHEYELLGIDVTDRLVFGINSWGDSYGFNGFFCMSWDTLNRLLHEQGDVTVLVPR